LHDSHVFLNITDSRGAISLLLRLQHHLTDE
jgi:hypothetical protein